MTTIDNQNTINQMLDLSDWEEAEWLPDDLISEYKLLVYQEKTLLYGQESNEERDYELIETLITYQAVHIFRKSFRAMLFIIW